MNRFFWSAGCFGVSLSVLENAWTAHGATRFNQKDMIALNNAVHIQMLNGVGMCLLSLR